VNELIVLAAFPLQESGLFSNSSRSVWFLFQSCSTWFFFQSPQAQLWSLIWFLQQSSIFCRIRSRFLGNLPGSWTCCAGLTSPCLFPAATYRHHYKALYSASVIWPMLASLELQTRFLAWASSRVQSSFELCWLGALIWMPYSYQTALCAATIW